MRGEGQEVRGEGLRVRRSLLKAEAIAEWLLPVYALPAPTSCVFWQGSINDTYLVRAGAERFVLRVAPADWRSPGHLEAELELLRFLHGQGARTPQPVARSDGSFVTELPAPEGARPAVLFTFVPGVAFIPSADDSRRYGRVLAQAHLLSTSFPPDRSAWRFELPELIDRPYGLLLPWLAERPDDAALLARLRDELWGATDNLQRSAPEYGICHGDINDNNILFGDNDHWALLDWEYCGYGWRIFDIATFCNNQLVQRGRTNETRALLDAFLQGYHAVRPLNEAERAALPAFVLLRQLWLWGTAVRFQPTIGVAPFQDWLYGQTLPFTHAWLADPWRW